MRSPLLSALLFVAGAACAEAPLPQRLSATGLYLPGTTVVRPEHIAFTPQYALWSDGATKRRWISLPPGTFIDATDPDAWEFPAGTRLWKEFAHGQPVETRYIERLADGGWRFATYVWNEAGTDAGLAPASGVASLPVTGAPGGRYAVPGEVDCRACHEGARVPVLGFSALQLSPDRDPLAPHAAPGAGDADLAELVARGLVRGLPPALLAQPPRIAAASPVARAALGYLHANCGHCHSGTEAAPPVDLLLAQPAGGTGAAVATDALLAARSRFAPPGFARRPPLVVAGDVAASVLPWRMRSRDPLEQMPPVGTRIPDPEGLVLVERWIRSLPTPTEISP
jgi:hypothetical protein